MRINESERFIMVCGNVYDKYTYTSIKRIMKYVDCDFIYAKIWNEKVDEWKSYDTYGSFLNALNDAVKFTGYFQLILVKKSHTNLDYFRGENDD